MIITIPTATAARHGRKPQNCRWNFDAIYTVSHKKPCHFVFDYRPNSGFSWSIFTIFVAVEIGRNTL